MPGRQVLHAGGQCDGRGCIMSMFLDAAELATLTGRTFKSLQISWLRENGVAFRVSATGHPVVARSVIEGGKAPAPVKAAWVPRVLKAG